MKLNLYNKCNGNIDTIFKWEPFEKQWWITGFNPDFKNPDYEKMIMIGTVDFTNNKSMYKSLKKYVEYSKKTNYIIFDDEEMMAWIMWGSVI